MRKKGTAIFGRRGFTLLEAALATVIVGVGVVATMGLFGTCTRDNKAAAGTTVGVMLAGQVQECMQGLAFGDPSSLAWEFGAESGESLASFDDMDDFDGQSLCPPVDALRRRLTDLEKYTQAISVMPVNPDQLNGNADEGNPALPKSAYTGAVRVRVRVLYRERPGGEAREVHRASWIALDR